MDNNPKSESSLPNEEKSPSKNLADFQNYFEVRYSRSFTESFLSTVRTATLETAKTQKGLSNLPTINTRNLLNSLTREGPLEGLRLPKLEVAPTRRPPWYEIQTEDDRYLSTEIRTLMRKAFGQTRLSEDFDKAIKEATETQPQIQAITVWHLTFALLSTGAKGFTWALDFQNTRLATLSQLQNNFMQFDRKLASKFQWKLLEDSKSPKENELHDNNSEWAILESLNTPKDFTWSHSCQQTITLLQKHFEEINSQHGNRGARPTPRALFLSLLQHGEREHPYLSPIARKFRKKRKSLRKLIQDEITLSTNTEIAERLSFSESFTKLAEKANELRNLSGEGKYVTVNHLFMALITSGQSDGYGFPVLKPEDLVSQRELLELFEKHLQSEKNLQSRESPSEWRAILKQFLDFSNEPTTPQFLDGKIGAKSHFSRSASSSELCLNIAPYSAAIAETLHSASDEDDFVFALYGPWGRGKTQMAKAVAEQLKEKKCQSIFFSAWKYPSRPEVWVHLYKSIFDSALEGDWLHKSRLSFQTNILRHGWFTFLLSLGLLLASRLTAWLTSWLANGLGAAGLLLLFFLTIRAYSTGRILFHRYLSLPDHADKLGLQAVIGQDLISLLKTWIKNPNSKIQTAPPPSEASDSTQPPIDEEKTSTSKEAKAKAFLQALKKRNSNKEQTNRSSPDTNEINFNKGKPGKTKRDLAIFLLLCTCAIGSLQIWQSPSEQKATPLEEALIVMEPQIMEISNELEELNKNIESLKETVGLKSSPPSSTNRTTSPLTEQARVEPSQKSIAQKITITTLFAAVFVFGRWFLLSMSRSPSNISKILLVVDDLDRCEPEQMLVIIESLRMFLDDPQTSARLQIMMLLDLRAVELALKARCQRIGILEKQEPEYFAEQREKWFVSELSLPPLSEQELNEAVSKIVNRETSATISDLRTKNSATSSSNKSDLADSPNKGAKQINEQDKNVSIPSNGLPSLSETTKEEFENTTANKPLISHEATADSLQTPSIRWSKDITYDEGDRKAIIEGLGKLNKKIVTPRRIRSITLRYQLTRLILRHLGENPKPQHIVECLLGPEQAAKDVPKLVKNVANSVSGTSSLWEDFSDEELVAHEPD